MAKPNFNDFNQAYRYNEAVETRLILSLPVTDFRPEAMRVTERKTANSKWFEVETFNAQRNMWIEQQAHPTEAVAIADAKGWYPLEDLSKCPRCGGDADNGIDNCIPPSAYMCSKCCAQEDAEKAGCTFFDERPEDPHLPAFHEALHAGYKGTFYEWHKEHFGTFWCPGVAA